MITLKRNQFNFPGKLTVQDDIFDLEDLNEDGITDILVFSEVGDSMKRLEERPGSGSMIFLTVRIIRPEQMLKFPSNETTRAVVGNDRR